MILSKQDITYKHENEKMMANQIGAYHAAEATKIFNEAVAYYKNNSLTSSAQERAIVLFKRAIPHLQACQKMDYRDHRITSILNGMINIMNAEDVDQIPLITA